METFSPLINLLVLLGVLSLAADAAVRGTSLSGL